MKQNLAGSQKVNQSHMPSQSSVSYCLRQSESKISDSVKAKEDLNRKIPKQWLLSQIWQCLRGVNITSALICFWLWSKAQLPLASGCKILLFAVSNTDFLKETPQPCQSKIYPCVKAAWCCPKKTPVCYFCGFLFVKLRADIVTAMKETQIYFH